MSISRVDCVPYSVAGFGDTLTHDLAHCVPAATQFFGKQDWRNWREIAASLDSRTYPRDAVCGILEKSAHRFHAPDASLANIQSLREPQTYVVATGQQAGLLGGPLLTLHKALSAIQLARTLSHEAASRAHFIPVFWVASDDHDLAEIDHAHLLAGDGTLARFRPRLSEDSAGRSACDARVDPAAENIAAFRQELAALIGQPAAEHFADLYAAHSMGDAFAALLTQWLGPLGLVIAPSSDLRVLGKDLLLRELEDYDVSSRLIQEAGLAMQAAGYKPGFSAQRSAPHFFLTLETSRVRTHLDPVPSGNGEIRFRVRSPQVGPASLPIAGGDARTGPAGAEAGAALAGPTTPLEFSKRELAELIAARPELFSAAAGLRPVLQQTLFPVAAAVLGPGEIRYWAQLWKVHEHFGAAWPAAVPRATMTLVDPQGEKCMRKLGLPPGTPDLFADAAALRKKVLTGGEAGQRLDARVAAALREFDALAGEVRPLDPSLSPMLERARERIAHELGRVADKTKASIGQREGAGFSRVQYLSTLTRPRNSPQERVLATGQWLAGHPNLPRELLEIIDLSQRQHMIVTVTGCG